jgi:ketosteroid isomerase-like protein
MNDNVIPIREANKQALARAMTGISSLDVDAVRAELHDDVVMQLPYEDAVPDLEKSGICELLTGVFMMYKQCGITFTDVYELVDPNQLIARYIGDFRGRDTDVHYANSYIGVFAFRDGKITLWCEYDNPLIVQASLADFGDMTDTNATSVRRATDCS